MSSEPGGNQSHGRGPTGQGHGGDRRASPAVRHLGWAKGPTEEKGKRASKIWLIIIKRSKPMSIDWGGLDT